MDPKHTKPSPLKRHHTRSQGSRSSSDEATTSSCSNKRPQSATPKIRRKKKRDEEDKKHHHIRRPQQGSSKLQRRLSRFKSIEGDLNLPIPKPEESSADNEEIDLETEYTNPEEVLQQYIDFATTASEIATKSIPHELDVPYYESFPGQKLDIFGTDLPDEAPILLYVHGGYWKQQSKDISRFPAAPLHKCGVKTIVVGYDQGPDVTLYDIVDQVTDAVIYAIKYAEEKKSRGVYIAGHCSGAHVIAKIIGNDEVFDTRTMKIVNGVFFISGLYDLRDFCTTSANETVNVDRMDAVDLSPLFSNYNHLEDSRTRFYVLAAQEDSSTLKKQARDFYEFLFEICPTENMYLEIKDEMDHFEIVKCLANDDNYLKHLILNDLSKHS